jgi:hypothetical protein
MAKRKKKRVKREPKPPLWLVFKSFNQTKEEVYFGASKATPKWHGSKYELQRIPELAHWDLEFDKIIIAKIYKRKRFPSEEAALIETQYWERTYDHWRNFWVIQTGSNKLKPPRERKPIKPPRLPYGYSFDPDMIEEPEEDIDDDDLQDDNIDTKDEEQEE